MLRAHEWCVKIYNAGAAQKLRQEYCTEIKKSSSH
jgi:hypothetical protein